MSPAGDRERLEAAVRFGADAVYLAGKQFGMRAAPGNFDPDALKEAVRYCHERNVLVYLTCNTVPTNEEVGRLPEFLKESAAAGIDALIVADIGVLELAKRFAPDIDVHISTQAGIMNYHTANELHRMGASRVVLARELSLSDIRVIRDKTPSELEIEAFVHGAMCVSFSGRCLLSNYFLGRDANRGECAQPCRWGYYLMEEKRPGMYFPIEEDERGSYILNAKDMCMIEHIDKLCEAGITSMKIEGRAKSSYYVATITNAYRQAIDQYGRDPAHFKLEDWILEETRKVSFRQYSTGFYFGRPEDGQFYENGGYVRGYEVIGVVEGCRDGRILCEQRNKFCAGDTVEILQPGKKPMSMTVQALYNGEGERIDAAPHPQMKFSMPVSEPVSPGAIIRRAKLEQGAK